MISQWYNGISLPTFYDTKGFKSFVHASLGIVQGIVGKNIMQEFFVTLTEDDKKVSIAAVDQINRVIYINSNLFSPSDKLRHNPSADQRQVLEMLIGLVVHEASHIEYTVTDIKESFEVMGFELNKLNKTVWNIIEDFYIEEQARINHPVFEWSLQSALDYFFPLSQTRKLIAELPNEITTMKHVTKFVGTLCNAKNVRACSRLEINENKLFAELVAMVKGVYKIHDKYERITFSKTVVEWLLKNVKEQDEEQNEEESSKGGSESGDKELDEISEKMDKVIGKEGIEVDSKDNVINTLKMSTQKVDDSTEQIQPVQLIVSYTSLLNFGFSKNLENHEIKLDRRFLPLSQLIKARSQANQPKGEQKNYGRSITQIHRIVTDSKVFATPITVPFVGPQEVVILVDCSGSMGMNEKITKALSAAYGAAMGLQNGGHKVKVIGHTCQLSGTLKYAELTESLMIYVFKNWHDSIEKMVDNMKTFLQFESTKGNNNDDYAVAFAGSQFTKERSRKNVIVISDGYPSSRRIDKEDGAKKTKVVVDKLRKSGVSVSSISIDTQAFDVNNRIYGAAYNINSEDAVNISKIVEGMFKI